jgi:Uma2 family endonuclease
LGFTDWLNYHNKPSVTFTKWLSEIPYHIYLNDIFNNDLINGVVLSLQHKTNGAGYPIYAFSEKQNCFYYPDVLITCDRRDRETSTYKRFPKLIIEVLSDSTEAFDRGDKFNDYQAIENLQEYVLVNSKHQRVEVFRQNESRMWLYQSYSPMNPTIFLQSLDLTINFTDLYEDVNVVSPLSQSSIN